MADRWIVVIVKPLRWLERVVHLPRLLILVTWKYSPVRANTMSNILLRTPYPDTGQLTRLIHLFFYLLPTILSHLDEVYIYADSLFIIHYSLLCIINPPALPHPYRIAYSTQHLLPSGHLTIRLCFWLMGAFGLA